ncbi:MAG: sigma-70 family RNA polymerase sigma factor [Verrucomicrobiota bacterium]
MAIESNQVRFTTTKWTDIFPDQPDDSVVRHDALTRLCQTYWYPLYAFVRQRGHDPHEAQDLTQGFFASLLAKDFLKSVAAEKGKFRTFLLAALKNYLANEWDRKTAQKRGGGQQIISIDAEDAESRFKLEPVDTMSADKIYERRWAMTVLDRALAALRAEQSRVELYDALKTTITGERSEESYAEIGARLNLTEGAVKVVAHRLRKRYRELIREEISDCVSSVHEIEEELLNLFAALSAH